MITGQPLSVLHLSRCVARRKYTDRCKCPSRQSLTFQANCVTSQHIKNRAHRTVIQLYYDAVHTPSVCNMSQHFSETNAVPFLSREACKCALHLRRVHPPVLMLHLCAIIAEKEQEQLRPLRSRVLHTWLLRPPYMLSLQRAMIRTPLLSAVVHTEVSVKR